MGTAWQWIYQPWPQWSPHVDGGTRIRKNRTGIRLPSPQWSPPVNSGTTRRCAVDGHAVVIATKESVGQRREDAGVEVL
jgi:hypothetical protein